MFGVSKKSSIQKQTIAIIINQSNLQKVDISSGSHQAKTELNNERYLNNFIPLPPVKLPWRSQALGSLVRVGHRHKAQPPWASLQSLLSHRASSKTMPCENSPTA